MRRALLLVNPESRRGREAKTAAATTLETLGIRLVQPSEENPANFPEIIRRFADKIDFAIIGGGDGTLRGTLRSLRQTGCPLGVLPLGTANNLARNLGVPLSLAAACAALATGEIGTIDLGLVNDRYFLNVSGLGLSTLINGGVPPELKRRWGVLAYALIAARWLNRMHQFTAEIECNNQSSSVRALQITVCNGRHFGAGMTIHPAARIDDARLDLCAFQPEHWWQSLVMALACQRGRHLELRGVQLFQGKEIIIRTRKPMWIDTDGEVITQTPAVFRLEPQALRVILPKLPQAASPDSPDA